MPQSSKTGGNNPILFPKPGASSVSQPDPLFDDTDEAWKKEPVVTTRPLLFQEVRTDPLPRVLHKQKQKVPWKVLLLAGGLLLLVCAVLVTQVVLPLFRPAGNTTIILGNPGTTVYYLPYTVNTDGSAPAAFPTPSTPTSAISTPPSYPTPTTRPVGWSILGKPTVTASFINKVLATYGSPAAGQGQAFYTLGVKYGIDPVYAIAFFKHESDFGTTGVARYTLSIGNSRAYDGNKICTNDGCYEKYSSWYQGIAEWYWQMTQYANGNLYQYLHGYPKDLVTVDQIIPVYAPSGDHNDVNAYIAAIKQEVTNWRQGIVRV